MTENRLQLTVYTDYQSPYAYVAKNAAKALAVEYPVDLAWLPHAGTEYLDAVDARSAAGAR
jgi:2-hydroxychromene-2-carboxylate isomerase